MPHITSRRQFLAYAAGTAAAAMLPACAAGRRLPRTTGTPLRLGFVGVGNRGKDNLNALKSQSVAALCDVDGGFLDKACAEFPAAARFTDFRDMLRMRDLDGVVVSTADHTHAAITAAALRAGLDVYCEKPLAHDLDEVRRVCELARERGAITQMGIQIHDHDNYRRVVEIVRSGVLGAVREVHVFCNGTNWSGGSLAKVPPPVPANLHFDLWLGPAREHAYDPAYHPAGWRRWWSFGNGTMGDMACHTMDLAFWALDLTAPETIEAEGPPEHPQTAPSGLRVRYQFPARGDRSAVLLTWYDGDTRPEILAGLGLDSWRSGVLFIGEKGFVVSNYDVHEVGPKSTFASFAPPPRTIPSSVEHHMEWVNACLTRRAPSCNFDYAGRLTEAVLLGVVSYRAGKRLEWDAERRAIVGCPEAEPFIRATRRRGWDL